MALSKRQELFCAEYVIDHNGRRAAEAAGWSEKSAASTASRLLKLDEIRERIGELEKNAAEACGLTAIGVISSIMETRDRCLQATPVMKYNKITREYEETGEYVFDSTGANRANELLGKHLGMFEEKTTLGGGLTLSPRELGMLQRAAEREGEKGEKDS